MPYQQFAQQMAEHGLTVFIKPRAVVINGRAHPLNAQAISVLKVLMAYRDQVVPLQHILKRVWPFREMAPGNVAVQIVHLRRLLGSAAIITHRGRGYSLSTRAALAGMTVHHAM